MEKKINGKKVEFILGEKVDLSNSNQLKEEFLELIDSGCKDVVLNFKKVEMIDSSGLGKILLFQKRLKEINGSLKIINIESEYVSKMFKMIHLDKVIDIEV